MKLRDRFIRFMQGRYGAYGTDAFTKFLLILTLVLIVATSFGPLRNLSILPFIILIYCYFRLFSKNVPKRYHENQVYMEYQNRFTGFFKNFKYNASQRKIYHVYKCPKCGQKIRIPRGKGKIIVRCPKCSTEFEKRS